MDEVTPMQSWQIGQAEAKSKQKQISTVSWQDQVLKTFSCSLSAQHGHPSKQPANSEPIFRHH